MSNPEAPKDSNTRTVEDAKTELQFIGGVFAGLAVLAYFAGFLVRYYFLDDLGLSPSSTTLPLYYFGVYGFAVVQRAPQTLIPIALMAAIAVAACETLRRYLDAKQDKSQSKRSRTVFVAYPTLGVTFLAALVFIPGGARATAREQFRELWLPRRAEGVRLKLRPALRARCNSYKSESERDDYERLACASDERRLVLVAESPRDLVFFERRKGIENGLPVTFIYRLKRDDVLMTTTKTGP